MFLVFLGAVAPFLEIEGAGKHDTSFDASREVSEKTLEDTSKEARLHGLAVSS